MFNTNITDNYKIVRVLQLLDSSGLPVRGNVIYFKNMKELEMIIDRLEVA